jgi:hypothetical protein
MFPPFTLSSVETALITEALRKFQEFACFYEMHSQSAKKDKKEKGTDARNSGRWEGKEGIKCKRVPKQKPRPTA